MLVAVSITLVLMSTVVGVFATVSGSVQKRRAATEVGNQLRHVRNVLQRDLEGATCPTLPWARPEANVGYFEIVEGMHSDFFPSDLTDGVGNPRDLKNPELDHGASTVPSSDLPLPTKSVTDGLALGDFDDILAFTSRNESAPFTGPAPLNNVDSSDQSQRPFASWDSQTITSPVAEVVWFCFENPGKEEDRLDYFGEPGYRTIYRRTLLVAPWLDYRYNVDGVAKSRPGLLRILDIDEERPAYAQARAIAALIAFQERYDISARIEFNPTIRDTGSWTIVANTLSDLTNREHRFEHHGLIIGDGRAFPYLMTAKGGGIDMELTVGIFDDLDCYQSLPKPVFAVPAAGSNDVMARFDVRSHGENYLVRPACFSGCQNTARAVINQQGRVVHLTTGLVSLGSASKVADRRGQDLMMSDALAFDVQVFDPAAPVYALRSSGVPLRAGAPELSNVQQAAAMDLTSVGPDCSGWQLGLLDELQGNKPLVVSKGAFVDLGYGQLHGRLLEVALPATIDSPFAGLPHAKAQFGRPPNWHKRPRADADSTCVYDTWSFQYECDGVNQDEYADGVDDLIDEGTNHLDDDSWYDDNNNALVEGGKEVKIRFGSDDPGEYETSPPYPVPLRAVQVKLRVYETDSRQIREVTVRQHFVPE